MCKRHSWVSWENISNTENICCDTFSTTVRGKFLQWYYPLFSVSETAFYFEHHSSGINRLDDTTIKVIYLSYSRKEDINRLSAAGTHLPPTKSAALSYRWLALLVCGDASKLLSSQMRTSSVCNRESRTHSQWFYGSCLQKGWHISPEPRYKINNSQRSMKVHTSLEARLPKTLQSSSEWHPWLHFHFEQQLWYKQLNHFPSLLLNT